MNRRNYSIASIGLFIVSGLAIAVGGVWAAIEITSKENKLEMNTVKTLYQDQTVCYSIGFDGWKRVTKRDRTSVAELVLNNKATVIEAQTLECVDYSKHPLEVHILREQWWKRLK